MSKHNIFPGYSAFICLLFGMSLGCNGTLPGGTCDSNVVGGAQATNSCGAGGSSNSGGAHTGGSGNTAGSSLGSSSGGTAGNTSSTGGINAASTGGTSNSGGADTGGSGIGTENSGGTSSLGGSNTAGSSLGGSNGGTAGNTSSTGGASVTSTGGATDNGGAVGTNTGGTSGVGGNTTGGTSGGSAAGLREGCALLLHMDENSWSAPGSVIDSSGNMNNGSPTGSAAITANGKFGNGGLFDGASSIVVNDSTSLRPTTGLTVAAWIFPTSIDGSKPAGVVAKRVDYGVSATFALFLFASNNLVVDIDTENDRFASKTVFANNTWYHVAVVYDGTLPQAERVHLYVNGTLDTTASESSSSIGQYTAPLQVGTLPTGGDGYGFPGVIDEVGVWTRALSIDEIAQLQVGPVP